MVKFLLSQCQDGVLRFKYISNEDVRPLKEVLKTLTYERALFLTARRILMRSQKILRFSSNVCFKLFVAWTPRHNEQVETQLSYSWNLKKSEKKKSDFACALSKLKWLPEPLGEGIYYLGFWQHGRAWIYFLIPLITVLLNIQIMIPTRGQMQRPQLM